MTTVTTAPVNVNNITAPRVPFLDARTGLISREWFMWFLNMFARVNQGDDVAEAAAYLATAPVAITPDYVPPRSLDYIGPAPFVPIPQVLQTTLLVSAATSSQQLTNTNDVVVFATDAPNSTGHIIRVGNTFEVNATGYYVWTLSPHIRQDQNNNITTLWVDLNGTEVTNSAVTCKSAVAGNIEIVSLSFAALLQVGDVVTFYANADTVNGSTLLFVAAAASVPAAPAVQVIITGYQL